MVDQEHVLEVCPIGALMKNRYFLTYVSMVMGGCGGGVCS